MQSLKDFFASPIVPLSPTLPRSIMPAILPINKPLQPPGMFPQKWFSKRSNVNTLSYVYTGRSYKGA